MTAHTPTTDRLPSPACCGPALFLAIQPDGIRLFDAGIDAGPTNGVVRFFALNVELQAALCLLHLARIERGDEALDAQVGEFEFFLCHVNEILVW